MYRLRNIKSSIIILQFSIKKKILSDSWWCAHKFKITFKKIIFANNLTFLKKKKKK